MEHESDELASLTSIVHIQASELYPKKSPYSEDLNLSVSFPLLHGEYAIYLGRISEGFITLSNFRLFVQTNETFFNLPLGLIEQVECKDIFYLHIYCKDARSIRCTFTTNEHCMEWYRRLTASTLPPKRLDDIFAFPFRAWCSGETQTDLHQALYTEDTVLFNVHKETERMGFNLKSVWRISTINCDYKFCPTYPKELLVPALIADDDLKQVASFRSSRRIPVVVWRHRSNCSVIARCSQPEVGWLGWRNSLDENLVQAIAEACALDAPNCTKVEKDLPNGTPEQMNGVGINGSNDKLVIPKILILDARSYAAAVANRAKGGGCECPEYYPNCEIQFMSLANIHYVRKSFHSVKLLCASSADQNNWFSMIENTKWLQHISGLLKSALVVVNAIDRDARPVLVHCSDGWDRTPQIVALAELMLDPYYRTLEGFQVLVEREWLEFGHKFGDRCGHGLQAEDTNERCPVFLQWLDCVHQLLKQYPCSFEFNETFLVKLVHHTYSCLFGTFLCNSSQERIAENVKNRTYSVWQFLKVNQHRFRNFLFNKKDQVLRPSCHVRDLLFWSKVYMPSSVPTEEITPLVPLNSAAMDTSFKTDREHSGNLCKTRSCDDLLSMGELTQSRQRRSSDPSVHEGKRPFCPNLENRNCDADPDVKLYDNNDDDEDETEVALSGNSVKYNCSKEPELPPDKPELVGVHKSAASSDENGEQKKRADSVSANCVSESHQNGDNTSFESSTDTLVGELAAQNGEAMLLEPQCNGDVCASPKLDHHDHRTIGNVDAPLHRDLLKNQQQSTISTSTSDLSDSHVGAREVTPVTTKHLGLGVQVHSWTRILQCASCPVCVNGKKLPESNHFDGFKSSSSGHNSVTSTPLHSRTPSSGFPATPNDERLSECTVPRSSNSLAHKLDVDGLTVIKDDVQHRLCEITSSHLRESQRLKQELYATRLALCQQVCHKCNGSKQFNQEHADEVVSLPDSVGSGDFPSLGHETNSDVSWEQVEENDTRPILWVPDHAVTRCTGCETEFWLGRRKHHCRNCGKIFCANCSSQMVPLPKEQLYEPVRVCSYCYDNLRSLRCKQQAAWNTENRLDKGVMLSTATTAAASN